MARGTGFQGAAQGAATGQRHHQERCEGSYQGTRTGARTGMIERAPHRMQRETPQKKFLRLGIDGLVGALVMLNWIATQLVAAALHYPPFFMGRILGRSYQPFAWWWWQYHWPHSSVEIGRNIIP